MKQTNRLSLPTNIQGHVPNKRAEETLLNAHHETTQPRL